MAPKKKKAAKKEQISEKQQHGMFEGMVVFLVENGVQPRRLQIWKQKLVLMGGTIVDRISDTISHIFAMNLKSLLQQVDREKLAQFKGSVLLYQWLEDSLKLGEKVSEDIYNLKEEMEGFDESAKSSEVISAGQPKGNGSNDNELPCVKKARVSPRHSQITASLSGEDSNSSAGDESPNTGRDDSHESFGIHNESSPNKLSSSNMDQSMPYSPPDLNRNITDIFGKLINIYRALGDDRRSFSYYKAIPVIEKLPFQIESVDQVKQLPTIGKAMQDHIHEIVTTGKLSKLEHFENDEKVRTISLFGEVWGIGPATALKLYEKGHRTLDDLKNEDSLTSAQKVGLKFFEDIKKRIPRHEVQDMELLLQKAAEAILPGVSVLCGGSFRRGKATCGDMDIIITHPDGESHKGFLARYVKHLKDIEFLREDLIFSTHSEEGTDSGIDTYFGLCTYPGRELRHRIDLKVYPRSIYAFGLIHWTGNDVVNRRLRILADTKGYRLDDNGLFLVTQSSGTKRGSKASASLSFKTEKEVFDFLGFPWLEPHERNL
ncbi:Dna polymerase lambda [Thalictrum thalictroides]|uniref:DNA polymerase n=1 Tax=Thalictrum thalictroides TaxID=46969 RepID=A0A7J6VEA1_THATH|nr:Dna polymerase lambda [Thalictrum thalictroides]